jgi:hypothetical protein
LEKYQSRVLPAAGLHHSAAQGVEGVRGQRAAADGFHLHEPVPGIAAEGLAGLVLGGAAVVVIGQRVAAYDGGLVLLVVGAGLVAAVAGQRAPVAQRVEGPALAPRRQATVSGMPSEFGPVKKTQLVYGVSPSGNESR